jgi:hypothetical protein
MKRMSVGVRLDLQVRFRVQVRFRDTTPTVFNSAAILEASKFVDSLTISPSDHLTQCTRCSHHAPHSVQ